MQLTIPWIVTHALDPKILSYVMSNYFPAPFSVQKQQVFTTMTLYYKKKEREKSN